MINAKANRTERPDKALFNAMMGVFFLLFAIAPAYWAFYNFGEFRQTSNFVRQLREKSDADATPSEKQERGERISFMSSRTERYQLEMFLSGAGAFVLFGISALLFAKAWKAKGKKNFYQNLDPQTVPKPNERIEVRHKKLYGILFWLILLFFGGMLLFILYQNFTSQYIQTSDAIIRSLMIGVPIILFLVIFCFVMLRANRQVVTSIDVSGIKRGDGRQFSWNEFCGKITQTAINRQTQTRYIWRIELVFADGETAWLIPNRIKNYDEVFSFISQLPTAQINSAF